MTDQPNGGQSFAAIIEELDLRPHPEGGFFRETYRSSVVIPGDLRPGFAESRAVSTAILFLLPEGSCSLLHRFKADEIWHFYLGGPLVLVELGESGTIMHTVLGTDILAGQKVQHVVPAARWFGAYPQIGSGFCLVGCTVAPGFEFEDLEFGRREELMRSHPGASEEIVKLTGGRGEAGS
jgi:uncharacterized protein